MVNVNIDDVIANNLPAFEMIIKIMESKYTVPIITPGMAQDDIMYRSGQYSVLLHFHEAIARVEARQTLPDTVKL